MASAPALLKKDSTTGETPEGRGQDSPTDCQPIVLSVPACAPISLRQAEVGCGLGGVRADVRRLRLSPGSEGFKVSHWAVLSLVRKRVGVEPLRNHFLELYSRVAKESSTCWISAWLDPMEKILKARNNCRSIPLEETTATRSYIIWKLNLSSIRRGCTF